MAISLFLLARCTFSRSVVNRLPKLLAAMRELRIEISTIAN